MGVNKLHVVIVSYTESSMALLTSQCLPRTIVLSSKCGVKSPLTMPVAVTEEFGIAPNEAHNVLF